MREFLPDDARRRLEPYLTDDLLEAYALLCEAVYWGVGCRDGVETERAAHRTAVAHDYFFGDLGLFGFKKEVDKALYRVAKELSRWEATRLSRRSPRPADRGRRGLARAGEAGSGDGEVGS